MAKPSKEFDAVVLGAGIAGLGVALAFARRGKKVLVVERSRLKGKASPLAAGILDPFLESEERSPWLDLKLRAFREFPSFIQKLSEPRPEKLGWEQSGLLYLPESDNDETKVEKMLVLSRKLNVPVKRMTPREMKLQNPSLSWQIVRDGIFYPSISKINPALLLASIRMTLKRMKAQFCDIHKTPHFDIQNNQIKGLWLGRQYIKTPVIVRAAGSWAGVDKDWLVPAPIKPARGQVFLVKRNFKLKNIIHSFDSAYAVPWDKRTVYIGSTVEDVGFRPHTNAQGKKKVLAKLRRLLDSSIKMKVIKNWAGLRPRSRDSLPIIGPSSIHGLFYAEGYFRSGILIGQTAGELLIKGIFSGKMPEELNSFHPRRFGL